MEFTRPSLEILVSMGFGEAESRCAMRLQENDPMKAIEWLVREGRNAALLRENPNQSQANTLQHNQSTMPHGNCSSSSSFPPPVSSSSSSSSSAPPSPLFSKSSTSVSKLINTRVKGIIQQIHDSSSTSTKPHGNILLQHLQYTLIPFSFDQFMEVGHDAAASSLQQPTNQRNNITDSLRSTLQVKDVVEFTLSSDNSSGAFTATSIVIIPTQSYAQVQEDKLKKREEESASLSSNRMRTLDSTIPLVLIHGTKIEADQNGNMVLRSASTFEEIAGDSEKHMNGFLNNSGGVALFGIDDEGTVVGTNVTMQDFDNLRMQMTRCMNESTPRVAPELYAFRYIPVYRLYKSSWVNFGSNPFVWRDGTVDPTDPTKMNLRPEPTDRLEKLNLHVIAIITDQGQRSVPFYVTSGNGHSQKVSFIRREGTTDERGPEEIAQVTKEHETRMKADEIVRIILILEQILKSQQSEAVASCSQLQVPVDDARQAEERVQPNLEPRSSGPE